MGFWDLGDHVSDDSLRRHQDLSETLRIVRLHEYDEVPEEDPLDAESWDAPIELPTRPTPRRKR
jgi:hypothetical protein